MSRRALVVFRLVPAWAAALLLVAGLAGGSAWAAFLATSSNSGNSFAAETDTTAPTISRAVLKKSSGYSGSYLNRRARTTCTRRSPMAGPSAP